VWKLLCLMESSGSEIKLQTCWCAQEHNPNVGVCVCVCVREREKERERERSNSQDFVPLLQKIFFVSKGNRIKMLQNLHYCYCIMRDDSICMQATKDYQHNCLILPSMQPDSTLITREDITASIAAENQIRKNPIDSQQFTYLTTQIRRTRASRLVSSLLFSSLPQAASNPNPSLLLQTLFSLQVQFTKKISLLRN
jgi:hypothetical protein